jgi:hypothetical protein
MFPLLIAQSCMMNLKIRTITQHQLNTFRISLYALLTLMPISECLYSRRGQPPSLQLLLSSTCDGRLFCPIGGPKRKHHL